MGMITYSAEHAPYCNVKCTRKDGHWMIGPGDEDFDHHCHDFDLSNACAECLKGRVKSWA